MTDVHDKQTRSYNMSMIKGQDTKPELMVRKYLHGKGLRYSLHNKNLPSKPDLCFRKYKKVVFINGCFWHGHENCKYFKVPASKSDWWEQKINATKERDKKGMKELVKLGWTPLVVWECELKSNKREETLNRIYLSITGEEKFND